MSPTVVVESADFPESDLRCSLSLWKKLLALFSALGAVVASLVVYTVCAS